MFHKQPAPALPSTVTGIWSYIPETSAIKRWTNELAIASNATFHADIWEILGHAVVIEHHDTDEVRNMVHHIAGEGNMQLHLINRECITNFSDCIKAVPSDEPTLIYLEPGFWLKNGLSKNDSEQTWPECPTHDDDKAYAFRKELATFLVTSAREQPIIFVTAVEYISQLDSLLRRDGLFDRRIKVPELEYEDVALAFISETGSEWMDESIHAQLKRVGCLVRHEFSYQRRRALVQKSIKRLAWRKGEKVSYKELVQFAAYGTAEGDDRLDPPHMRHHHAIHEAGHALVAYLDSKEKSVPEYCSVIKRGGTHGIMIRAYESHERISDDLSYQDMTHNIRVALGGRVAEHLILGPLDASARGSINDMKTATQIAGSLFGKWGHSTDVSSDTVAASNLAVCIGTPSDSEYEHTEKLIRTYLQTQFLLVLNLLRENVELLHSVVDALNQKTVLLKDDFIKLIADQQSIKSTLKCET
jgi:hypothetical protein